MRNKYFFSLLLCAFVLFTSSKCKKDGLTKPTQNGANTFSCKVNGKVFVAKDVYSVPITPGFSAYYDETKKEFTIFATERWDKSDRKKTFSFKLDNLSIGTNTLNNSNLVEVVISQRLQLDEHYHTTSVNTGTLNISKLDTVVNIISGTFSFQAVSTTNATSIITVTDGRFDGKY